MSENKAMKKLVGDMFLDIADSLETGQFGKKVKVGLTTLGSEHGTENLVKGAELALGNGFEIVLIGPKPENSKFEVVEVQEEDEMHKKMEELLANGDIDACVTMHYNFPIGVSTVGKLPTPALGKEIFLSTTTGTSSVHRTEAMVKNTIYGIIAAKAAGIENPTVGILNIDGANPVENALKELKKNGYDINFGDSIRADGGTVMRGNDLLAGAADVMVMDSLTGNIMMKMLSSFSTGGSYEAIGSGYGPGIGKDQDDTILIISRASGAPVVAGALKYAASLVKGDINQITKDEFAKAEKAKLNDILKGLTKSKKSDDSDGEEVKQPPKEVVTEAISGIDILDLEDAATELWKHGIYAETGMGCTGPIVQISEANLEKGLEILAKAGYVSQEGSAC